MRRGIVLTGLFLLGALTLSTTAMAYDDLITHDTAAVKAAGAFDVSASLLYTTASKQFDADNESVDLADDATQIRVPLKANYGVMENLSVFAIVPIVSTDDGTDSESGIGDVWLGAKYGILPENLLTVRGALDIPAGDDDKGLGNAGGFGIDVAAMSMYQVEKIGMNGQVGIRWNAEDGDTKWAPGIGFYLAAEGDYAFTEAFKGIVGLEFKSVADGEADGTEAKDSGDNYLDISLGASYGLAEKMSLRGDVYYTVAGKNTNQDLGILVNFCYMVK